jgi:hypothetical protein
MKFRHFSPQPPPEVRRPTVAQSGASTLIFTGWGPRLGA